MHKVCENDGLSWPQCDVLNLPHLRPIAPTLDDRVVAIALVSSDGALERKRSCRICAPVVELHRSSRHRARVCDEPGW